MSTFEIALLAMIAVLLIMMVYLIVRVTIYIAYDRSGDDRMTGQIMSLRDRINESTERSAREINDAMMRGFASVQSSSRESMREVSQTMRTGLESIRNDTDKQLTEIRDTTNRNLADIRTNINEKLDDSLNKRLDTSFKQVGDQLEALYKSLGELKNLESGVASLNRTLANVKTRGIYGETQLRKLLTDIMDRSQ